MLLSLYHKDKKKAVAYYRHSGEDKQENSIPIQRERTVKFARENNIEIIHEEIDEGKTGLLDKRQGFENIFNDWVQNPNAPDFDYVFVYDVSRWGRFQDQDQAGYYVFLCRKHGKEVVYTSRGFPDVSNQLVISLETSIHRYMAAEYSSQLSEKVFYGSVKVSEQGYSAGGTVTYGMARQLLDVNKKPIRILKKGEHKQIANERVSFTPKNDITSQVVKKIFLLFVEERFSVNQIADYLNDRGKLSATGKLWDRSKIVKILTNEIYIGTRIYNKTWGRLKQKSHKNPRSEWVVVPDAFKALVNKKLFYKAQTKLYWTFPNNWRKGINAIKRTRRNLKNDVCHWLQTKGYSEFEAEKIVFDLPIIFSVKLQDQETSKWCFLITEKDRRYKQVLSLSVLSDSKKTLDQIFLLPIKKFTKTNFLILSENDTLYQKSKIEQNNIEQTINSLIALTN